MFEKFKKHKMVRFVDVNPDTLEATMFEVYRNDKIKVTVVIRLQKDWSGSWLPTLVEISQDESLNTIPTEYGKSIFGNIIFRRPSTTNRKPLTIAETEKILTEFMNHIFYST